MKSQRQNLRRELSIFVEQAREELFFMHPRYTRDYIQQQAALLAQRSPEEVNRHLSARAFKLREACGKNRAVNVEQLYVIVRENEASDSFECGYLLGKTYFDPPLILPTSNQLKGIWEYLLTLPLNYGWCEFQQFVEKKIMEALHALQRYEEMLEGEIISLEYALLSREGVQIHNALYAHARETCNTLNEQERLLKKSKAPIFMQNENSEKMNLAKRVLTILVGAKARI